MRGVGFNLYSTYLKTKGHQEYLFVPSYSIWKSRLWELFGQICKTMGRMYAHLLKFFFVFSQVSTRKGKITRDFFYKIIIYVHLFKRRCWWWNSWLVSSWIKRKNNSFEKSMHKINPKEGNTGISPSKIQTMLVGSMCHCNLLKAHHATLILSSSRGPWNVISFFLNILLEQLPRGRCPARAPSLLTLPP
jgi:hypothetical protein